MKHRAASLRQQSYLFGVGGTVDRELAIKRYAREVD